MDSHSDYQPFPVDVLPEPLRSLTTEASRAIGCDPVQVALSVVATCAGAIGLSHIVRIKGTWTEPAVIWGAIVSPSGTIKSPSLRVAIAPLVEAQADDLRRHRKRVKDAQDRAEAEAGPGRKHVVDVPPCDRILARDTTIEALYDVLLSAKKQSVLVARDELDAWLGSHNAYKQGKGRSGGGDTAAWLELHSAGDLLVDRRGRSEPLHVPRAAVSIIGTVQPEVLAAGLAGLNMVNGVAARLLKAMPPVRTRRWTDAEVPKRTLDKYAELIRGLLALDPMREMKDGEAVLTPHEIPLTPEARNLFACFVDDHGEEQAGMSGPLRADWSKLEGYAVRFALVLHLVGAVAEGSEIGPIDDETMRSGIRLARWFGGEARRVYTAFATGDEEGGTDYADLRAWIEKQGGSCTVRDLTRGPRRYRETVAAQQALDTLADRRLGAWEWRGSAHVFVMGGDGDTPGGVKNGASVATHPLWRAS